MDGEFKIDRIRTREEFAAILSVSTRTLARMEGRGELPPRVQVSDRRIGWRSSDIEKFIQSRSV
jgi:predicted DNA-binding transcriptional regulator AlpA